MSVVAINHNALYASMLNLAIRLGVILTDTEKLALTEQISNLPSEFETGIDPARAITDSLMRNWFDGVLDNHREAQ